MAVACFQCPSDATRAFRFPPTYRGGSLASSVLTRGNYAANWGNTNWSQSDSAVAFHKPPFLLEGVVRPASVTDGLSGTIFLAEIRQGRGHDARGVPWLSMPGGASYMAVIPPNGVRGEYDMWPEGTSKRGDLLMRDLCVDEAGLPCAGDSYPIPERSFTGARSQHPGVVLASMGDASVRAIKNSVNFRVWLALHTIAGGETISADAYCPERATERNGATSTNRGASNYENVIPFPRHILYRVGPFARHPPRRLRRRARSSIINSTA